MPKVLIANRGEVAVRIIRTAHKMGWSTVAIYSEADAGALYTQQADQSVYIGPADPSASYLNIPAVIEAAVATGADAIHPGYGFLAENPEFAEQVEAHGIIFIGPTVQQLRDFGDKNTARKIALAANIPMVSGTGLLNSVSEAVAAADQLGYPVMLKATGGGGGIGMQACENSEQLQLAYATVIRLAQENFASAGVFLERLIRPARHIEVQIFGDGAGNVAILGDRDCSLQRRNQKVIEEAPAPNLPEQIRELIYTGARRLAHNVSYRSVGTIEFIYDPIRCEVSFLEVNARLQVEHPVTEQVYHLDVIEQMLTLAWDGPAAVHDFITRDFIPDGHAIEARIYAEDPVKKYIPSPGVITQASFPRIPGIRVDTGIAQGSTVSPFYDPMIAKIISHAPTRREAIAQLKSALLEIKISGIVTNKFLLTHITDNDDFLQVQHHTGTLTNVIDSSARIDVIEPGILTTIQDLPGRVGLWNIGIPPSGPMDNRSFSLANIAVGNPPEFPALECTMTGPTLYFTAAAVIAVTGAPCSVSCDGTELAMWEPHVIDAGSTLQIGTAHDVGIRTYVAIRGGFDEPAYLGSVSTFSLGKFGGHAGRALVKGDVLRWNDTDIDTDAISRISGSGHTVPDNNANNDNLDPSIAVITGSLGDFPHVISESDRPLFTHTWELAVLIGPQGAPEYLTDAAQEILFSQPYKVHFNISRTGVRLIGPKPTWNRSDGGEAGLHPSNIHDNPYAIGAINLSGDTPIILGVDGPSLGGFICPAVVATHEQWKIGQLRPGDSVRFILINESAAHNLREKISTIAIHTCEKDQDNGIIFTQTADQSPSSVAICGRRAGANGILIEYGEPILDIGLRMRVHALETTLNENPLPGIREKTPGIRSLFITYDEDYWDSEKLMREIIERDRSIADTHTMTIPSRIVRMPLSWNDVSCDEAIDRYMSTVRAEAPWLPSNIEFIRRINGLDSWEDVYNTIFRAQYLVLGLGDVYLGAPVATPLDPRHRLVTTKYNPARTVTPENAVGLGGSYLCIYGLEGPGGYQLIGRTVPIYSRYCTQGFFAHHPWALEFFDRISWYPVSTDELAGLRREVAAGKEVIEIVDSEFSYPEYAKFLQENAVDIDRFTIKQQAAFEAEKRRWETAGEFDSYDDVLTTDTDISVGDRAITCPIMGGVWRIEVEVGHRVVYGQVVAVLEAMKMETPITADCTGTVRKINITVGQLVMPGDILMSIIPND